MDREALTSLGLSGDPDFRQIRKAYLAKTGQERFQTAIFEDPERSRDFARLHNAYVKLMHEMDESGHEINAHSSSQDDIFQLLFNQGVYQMIQQNFIRAGEKFQEASRVRADSPMVHLYMGILLLKRRNQYAAEKYLREAARLLPANDAPWYYLAETYRQAGKRDKAIESLRMVMKLNPQRLGIAERIKNLMSGKEDGDLNTPARVSLLDRILGRNR